jgi:hypothetical protein
MGCECKKGKVNGSLLCFKNIYKRPWKSSNVLKVKNLFCTIINMMIIFHFIFKMLKIPILKIDLSRIVFYALTCTRCLILQNGLHVDEFIFIFET